MTAGAKIFGVGTDITVSASYSKGKTIGYSSSNSSVTSYGVSNTGGLSVGFKTPGGGMFLGLAKRYKFDKSQIPARIIVKCKGHEFWYETKVDLDSTTYGHTQYKSYTKRLKQSDCTDDLIECLFRLQFDSFQSFKTAEEHFYRCFQPNLSEKPPSQPLGKR